MNSRPPPYSAANPAAKHSVMNTAAAVQPPADAAPEHLADEEAFRVAELRLRDWENGRSDALPPDEVIRGSHVR